MPRGYKDYRQVTAAEEPEGKFSVHGTTRMYDDFEDTPLKWTGHHTGACSEARLATAAYNGSFGLNICAQKTIGAYGENLVERYTPLGERRTMELATYWRYPTEPTNAYYEFRIQHFEGAQEQHAAIRYIYDGGVISPRWDLHTTAGWIPLTGSENPTPNAEHEIIIACDFASGMYLYARSNHHVFEICNEPLYTVGGAPGERNRVAIVVHEINGDVVCLDIDDVLLKEL